MGIFQSIRGANNCTISNSNIINGNSNTTGYISNKANINGKSYNLPNGNISIINGVIYVDGKEFDTDEVNIKDARVINIKIEGNVDKINCNGSVEVKGNVGEIDCGGSTTITGDIKGNIDCGGSCSIRGSHVGNIDAGGSVSIR